MPRIKKKTEENLVTYSVLDREISNSDFLGDPDLHRDHLPQPYRRIDKILQDLLENVWNILEKNDNERKIEQSKPRAQKYSVYSVLEGLDDFNCMCNSTDDFNDFIFIGSNGFIHCVDVTTMSIIAKVDLGKNVSDTSTNIINIYTAQIKQSAHLIVSISDTGFVFFHVFMVDNFYPVQPLINDSDAERKYIYRKCEISKNAELLAFFVEGFSLIVLDIQLDF
ncbi:unnamed protein product [Brachionus calyciflorus]|uniref:Uncharacterized protein n=1 Tax=Brachionus calyciflorus TaxID=104777 RepID=A0A814CIA1_9BILA|nr:unnamed protein product [Brachionus calyciflorus]